MDNIYYKIETSEINETNVYGIIKLLEENSDKKLYVNVKNTNFISVSCLYKLLKYPNMHIRVEGGYDDDRLKNYPLEDHLNFHKYDNIYTVPELIKIMKEIRKIEAGIYTNWSSEQKLLYLISCLQDRMIYYLDEKVAPSNVIRSLRGLYTRKTVCAGFSMILKELCDRNGIECDYVEGACNKKDAERGYLIHAWNIVKINGNYFPVDLTFNAGKYVRGEDSYIMNLCNAAKFIRNHIPGKYEKLQDYKNNLKSMDANFIRKIWDTINQNKYFDSTKFYCNRRDGSKYIIYQLDGKIVNGEKIYKYIYCDFLSGNRLGLPIILYSSTNISEFLYVNDRDLAKFNKSTWLIDELLFSKNNILQAIKKRNNYVGCILYDERSEDFKVAIETKISRMLRGKRFKTFKRKDGSNLIAELVDGYPININNHEMYCYNIYEYFVDNGNIKLKLNTVYTDFDILLEKKRNFASDYLDRKRINECVRKSGGYLGYYSNSEVNYTDNELRGYFDLSKKIEMTDSDVLDLYTKLSFQEMKELIINYKVVRDKNDNMYIVSKKSGNVINDRELCIKAKFANLWVYSTCNEDTKSNEFIDVAFSEFNRDLFSNLCSTVDDFLSEMGNIDTVGVLYYLSSMYRNNNSEEIYRIITKLFKTDETNQIVNEYFRLVNPSAIRQTEGMEKLIDINTAKSKVREYRRKLSVDRNGLLEVTDGKKGAVIKKYKYL